MRVMNVFVSMLLVRLCDGDLAPNEGPRGMKHSRAVCRSLVLIFASRGKFN